MELELVVLSLKDPTLVPLLLNILSIFDKQFIFVNLELIALFSEVDGFLLGLAETPLHIIEVTSQLSVRIAVLRAIFDAQLQGMIVLDKLLDLLLMSSFSLSERLLILLLARFNLRPRQLQLALHLVVCSADLLELSSLRVQLATILVLKVLLNPHAENVLIDRQLHLLSKHVKLAILTIKPLLHGLDALLALVLRSFPRSYLIDQSLLVRVLLGLERLVMMLEVGEQL